MRWQSAETAEEFYRGLLEEIADWPRRDRGRRLAESGLRFWDAMEAMSEIVGQPEDGRVRHQDGEV